MTRESIKPGAMPPPAIANELFSNLRRGVPLGLDALSTAGVPMPLQPDDYSGAVGDLRPNTIAIGRNGSSLLAALSVSITSVLHSRSAQELFDKFTFENHGYNPTTTDSPRRLDETIKRVNNFKLPELRQVTIEPLVDLSSERKIETIPLANASNALAQGAAIVMPIRRIDKAAKNRGRIAWGAVTGYSEHTISQTDNDESDYGPPTAAEAATKLEFVVAMALRKTGILALPGVEAFTEELDYGKYARVVRALPNSQITEA